MANSTIPRPKIGWNNYFPNGESLFNVGLGIYRTSNSNIPYETLPNGNKGALIIAGNGAYPFVLYIQVSGKVAVWSADITGWVSIN